MDGIRGLDFFCFAALPPWYIASKMMALDDIYYDAFSFPASSSRS